MIAITIQYLAVVNRRRFLMLALSAAISVGWVQSLGAQDLAPCAYVITPVCSNAITLTWSHYDGSIQLNGAGPITGAQGKYSVPIFNYYHSFSLFGRSANALVSLPYGVYVRIRALTLQNDTQLISRECWRQPALGL